MRRARSRVVSVFTLGAVLAACGTEQGERADLSAGGAAAAGVTSSSVRSGGSQSGGALKLNTTKFVGDFDGDFHSEYAEVLTANGMTTVQVSQATGEATSTWISHPAPAANYQIWFQGDFNGDSLQDMARLWDDNDALSIDVYLSNGTSFSRHRWATRNVRFHHSNHVLVNDFSGDGKSDVVVLRAGEPTLTGTSLLVAGYDRFVGYESQIIRDQDSVPAGGIWLSGYFSAAASTKSRPRAELAVVIPDANQHSSGFRAYVYTTHLDVLSGFYFIEGDWGRHLGVNPRNRVIALGDFDGDKRDDFTVVNTGAISGLYQFRSTGQHFQKFYTHFPGGISYSGNNWYTGDFNGDGRNDIASGRSFNGVREIDVYLTKPVAGYEVVKRAWLQPHGRTSNKGALPTVVSADLTGDGRTDLWTTNRDELYEGALLYRDGDSEGIHPADNYPLTQHFGDNFALPHMMGGKTTIRLRGWWDRAETGGKKFAQTWEYCYVNHGGTFHRYKLREQRILFEQAKAPWRLSAQELCPHLRGVEISVNGGAIHKTMLFIPNRRNRVVLNFRPHPRDDEEAVLVGDNDQLVAVGWWGPELTTPSRTIREYCHNRGAGSRVVIGQRKMVIRTNAFPWKSATFVCAGTRYLRLRTPDGGDHYSRPFFRPGDLAPDYYQITLNYVNNTDQVGHRVEVAFPVMNYGASRAQHIVVYDGQRRLDKLASFTNQSPWYWGGSEEWGWPKSYYRFRGTLADFRAAIVARFPGVTRIRVRFENQQGLAYSQFSPYLNL